MKESIPQIYKEKAAAYLTVLDSFDKAGIEYVLLNTLIPDENPGDIDVLLCTPKKKIIESLLTEYSFSYYARYEKGQYLWNKYLPGIGFIQFHIYDSLCACEKQYFPLQLINTKLQTNYAFNFLVFLIESLCKSKLRIIQYQEYVARCPKEQLISYVNEVNRSLLEIVLFAIDAYEKNALDIAKAKSLLWGKRTTSKILSYTRKIIRRIVHLFEGGDKTVLFLGVDGAGKSTLIDGVSSVFSKGGILPKSCYLGIRESIFSKGQTHEVNTETDHSADDDVIHKIPLSLMRFVKILLMWVEYNIKYLLKIKFSSYGVKTLYLVDRCYLDIMQFYPYKIVDILFMHLSMMPKQVVFLTGNMDELYNRKKEMSKERYQQVYSFYNDILQKIKAKSSKKVLIIETTKARASESIINISDVIANEQKGR